MIQRPILKPNLGVEVISEEGCCFVDDDGIRILVDPRYEALLPLLDGQNSVDDIADLLDGTLPMAEVYFALMELEDSGYTVEYESFQTRTTANECALLSANPAGFKSNLNGVFVIAQNLTRWDGLDSRFVSALTDAGVRAGTDPSAPGKSDRTLCLALVDDYLCPEVERYYQARVGDDLEWLLVKPSGVTAWVGPVFSRQGSICWECLARRLRINRIAETYIRGKLGRQFSSPSALLPAVESVAKSLVVGLVVNQFGQSQLPNENVLIEFDFRRAMTERHPVVAVDGCARCSSSHVPRRDGRVVLESRPKVHVTDGGYRSVDPMETLGHERRLVSRHTGLVSRLSPLGGASALMPVYVARHNYGYVPSSLSSAATNLANTSAGKGRSATQARASALCEAVERHSMFLQGSETIVAGSLDEMGDEAIHPNACMLYSDHQYTTREVWNRKSAWTLRVPDPLDTSESIAWSPLWSLTEKRFKYLPTAYLYHSPHVRPRPRGCKCCFSDSNGNASGNNLEEAVLQGFLELVERDAVAIWWYNQLSRPIVNLDHLDDPYIHSLVKAYQAAGREVWVLDITHDFGIPTYVAVSRVANGPRDEILTGFGTHFSSRIAITRAITEVNQVLPLSRQSARRVDAELEAWFNTVSMETAPFLSGIADGSSKPLPAAIGPDTGNLLDDVHYCQSLVEQKGMEFLVLDQTRQETGLSSVKVIVPGMRHYWRRLAPGRLYQVPVDLGWLDVSREETALNPISKLG